MALKEWREHEGELTFWRATALAMEREVAIIADRIQFGKIESIDVPGALRDLWRACRTEGDKALFKYQKVSRLKDSIRETFKQEGYTIGKVNILEIQDGFDVQMEVKTKNKKL